MKTGEPAALPFERQKMDKEQEGLMDRDNPCPRRNHPCTAWDPHWGCQVKSCLYDKQSAILNNSGLAEATVTQQFSTQFEHFQEDAPACDICGAITVRNGTCYKCFNCGNSMGCS